MQLQICTPDVVHSTSFRLQAALSEILMVTEHRRTDLLTAVSFDPRVRAAESA